MARVNRDTLAAIFLLVVCGVFLVAGGQGTRLGFEGPKGCLPVGPLSGKTLFQLHAEKLRRLGELYRDGAGVTRNLTEAAGFFRQACDGEVGHGCYELAVLMSRGQGVTRDLAQAVSLLRKGCTEGDPRGCVTLGALAATKRRSSTR